MKTINNKIMLAAAVIFLTAAVLFIGAAAADADEGTADTVSIPDSASFSAAESGELCNGLAALRDAVPGEERTITLTEDLGSDSEGYHITVPADVTVFLDLNGHTINGGTDGSDAGFATITNHGALTITDSAGDGVIKRADVHTQATGIRKPSNWYYVIDNDGTLVINRVTIENDAGTAKTNAAGFRDGVALIRNGNADTGKAGMLTINGMTSSLNQKYFSAVENAVEDAKVTLNDGFIECEEASYAILNFGQLEMNDGIITGPVGILGRAGPTASYGSAVINGGVLDQGSSAVSPGISLIAYDGCKEGGLSVIVNDAVFGEYGFEIGAGTAETGVTEKFNAGTIRIEKGLFTNFIPALPYVADGAELRLGDDLRVDETITVPADKKIYVNLLGFRMQTKDDKTPVFDRTGCAFIKGIGWVGPADPTEFLAPGYVWSPETYGVGDGGIEDVQKTSYDETGKISPEIPLETYGSDHVVKLMYVSGLPMDKVFKVSYANFADWPDDEDIEDSLASVDITLYDEEGDVIDTLPDAAEIAFVVTCDTIEEMDRLAVYHGSCGDDKKTITWTPVPFVSRVFYIDEEDNKVHATLTVESDVFSPFAVILLEKAQKYTVKTSYNKSRGSVSVEEGNTFTEGTPVYFTVKAKSGNTVKSVSVTGKSATYEHIDLGDDFVFFMPKENVTITVSFASDGSSSSSPEPAGGSVWATAAQTSAPTSTPEPTQEPTVKPTLEIPVVKPEVKETATETPAAKSPVPIMGILAGLGAAAVLFAVRMRQRR